MIPCQPTLNTGTMEFSLPKPPAYQHYPYLMHFYYVLRGKGASSTLLNVQSGALHEVLRVLDAPRAQTFDWEDAQATVCLSGYRFYPPPPSSLYSPPPPKTGAKRPQLIGGCGCLCGST